MGLACQTRGSRLPSRQSRRVFTGALPSREGAAPGPGGRTNPMSTFSTDFRVFVPCFAQFRALRARWLAAALGSAGLVACGGSINGAEGPSQPGEVTHRDIRVSHAPCAVESGEKINVGGDSR